MKKRIIAILVIMIMLMIGIFIWFNKDREKYLLNNADNELMRARTYALFEDGDDAVEDLEGNTIDGVKFGAFFLRDIDGDGYADKIKGTCKQIGKQDNLYMELNVQTEGKLVNGKIEIGGENFLLQTALPRDEQLKDNYIGDDIKLIEFNDIESGTQKMLTGIVRSGDYSYYSLKSSAINNNINNYSAVNKITLTGTYVVEDNDGTRHETEIRKEIDLQMDWYGTTYTQLSSLSQEYSNKNIVNEEENEINLSFNVYSSEYNNELLIKDSYISIEIPQLNGYDPKDVSLNVNSNDYTYDATTRKIEYMRMADVDGDGSIIKNGFNGVSSWNSLTVNVKYPLEAYESLGNNADFELQVPVKAYFEGYNNPNSEFTNPYKSNIATQLYTIKYQKPAESESYFKISVGEYMTKPIGRYVVSKKKPLRIYGGQSTEEINDFYKVLWYVNTGSQGDTSGIIMKETPNGENKIVDTFEKGDGSTESMENVTSNVGVYFYNATSMLGDDGWIKVYDDETDNLIMTFEKRDWTRYSSENPYYYDVPIKHIRVETSATNALSTMSVYNIKELDDEYITENYTREEFDNLKKIYSHLVGYLGENKLANLSACADYDAPCAIANISISKNNISTQATEKNEIIKIKTEVDSKYDELGWINGCFLVKMPADVFDVNINSVSINNDSVYIDSFEEFEEDGINFIKIITSNEKAADYTISIDCDVTSDPRIVTKTAMIELYASNENAEYYYYSSRDIYDVNGNLNTSEYVNKNQTSISFISPNSLLTGQTAQNYDDEGTIVIAPKIALLDKDRRLATINVEIKNNYTSTISEISVLGRIPFEGNKYVINGKDLGSNYNATMTEDGIIVPEALRDVVTIYYSENGEATKELSLESNEWKTEVEDFSLIKSYLIVLDNYSLSIGESHIISYNINIPEGLSYNQVAYSHHAVYFCLDTSEGKYRTQTEPNKIGFMIAKQYDLEVIKYQKDTDKLIGGAIFSIQEEGKEESKTRVTGVDGKLLLTGLYVDRNYVVKEIRSPRNYEINEDEIIFVGNENDATLGVNLISGNPKSIVPCQSQNGEDYKIQVQLEDEVCPNLKIIKQDEDTSEKLAKVKYKITGKDFPENGKIITTNSVGEAILSSLHVGEEYTLEETKAEGYYLANRIKFRIDNENGIYAVTILEGNIKQQNTIVNDFIPTINVVLEDKKIPTYDLEITKIKHLTNVETTAEPSGGNENTEEITYLAGAKFKLYKNGKDLGSYTTDESGKLLIKNLYQYDEDKNVDQTYVLKEVVTPEGYAKVKDITFRVVNELGTLKYEEILEEGQSEKKYTVEGDKIKLVIEDSPSFKLLKKDSETDEVLANVKFSIYNMDDGESPARNSKGEIIGTREIIDGKEYYTIETDSTGEITADLPEGFYKVVEVRAPEEYDIDNSDYYFGIGASRESGNVLSELNTKIVGKSTMPSYVTKAIKTMDGGYMLIGRFYSGYTLDDGTVLNSCNHLGNHTAFIIKYDSEGNTVWGDSIDGPSYGTRFYDIVEMNNGDCCVIAALSPIGYGFRTHIRRYNTNGEYVEFLNNNDTSKPYLKLSKLSNDNLVIMSEKKLEVYDNSYNLLFEKESNDISFKHLMVDDSDNIYIVGSSTNANVNFDSEMIFNNNSEAMSQIILKFDLDGNLIAHNYLSGDSLTISDTSVNEDSLCLSGYYSGDLVIGDVVNSSKGEDDVFVIKYNWELEKEWINVYGDTGDENITYVGYDDTDIIVGLETASSEIELTDDISFKKETDQGTIIMILNTDGELDEYYNIEKYYKDARYIDKCGDNYFIFGQNYSGYYSYPRVSKFECKDNTLTQVRNMQDLGNTNNDSIEKVISTSDGGYIVGGSFNGICTIDGYNSLLGNGIIKYNKYYEVEWASPTTCVPKLILENADNYIIASNNGDLLYFNKDGDLIWSSTFDNTNIYCIDKTVEGNILIGGSYQGIVSFGNDIFLYQTTKSGFYAEFDEEGNCIGAYSVSGDSTIKITSIKGTIDNGILIAGDSFSSKIEFRSDIVVNNSTNYNNTFIAKFNSYNNCEWAKEIGNYKNTNNYISKIFELENKDIVICGTGGGGYLEKIDRYGEFVWKKLYTSPSSGGTMNDIIQTNDNGFLLSGYYYGSNYTFGSMVINNNGDSDGIIIKINEDGNIEWLKGLGNDKEDSIKTIAQLSDNAIVAGGYFKSLVLEEDNAKINNHNSNTDGFLAYILEKKNVEEINELEIKNHKKKFKIKTRVKKNSESKGGSISGEDLDAYEYVDYGSDSSKEIKIVPKENYEILDITINGENHSFEVNENGEYILPPFENVLEDKEIVVSFSLKSNKLTLKKVDSSNNEIKLSNALFKIDQIEERTEPIIGNLLGNIEPNSDDYYFVANRETDEVLNVVGNLVDNGQEYVINEETMTFNFIEEDGKFVSTNQGYDDTTSNSYVIVDLSEESGEFELCVNAKVSSQENKDYGYVNVLNSADRIPANLGNGRVLKISGVVSASDYTYSLRGGQKYYVHIGYYKDSSISENEDKFFVNSVKVYRKSIHNFYFDSKDDGSYESNNAGYDNTYARSYLPLDLSECYGKFNLTIKASVSSESSYDYGYVTITENTEKINHDQVEGRIIHIAGQETKKDYTVVIEGEKRYYLHLGYYKDARTSKGEDKFTIHNISLTLNDSELRHVSTITNYNGEAMLELPFGKYEVTEIQPPDGYYSIPEPTILEFRANGNHEFVIENDKIDKVIVHHYLKGTTTSVAEDDILYGKDGEIYNSYPNLNIMGYELEKVEGEFVFPINKTGTYTYEDIEVTYYYVQKKIPLTVYHYIEGTNLPVPLNDGSNASSIKMYGDENEEYRTSAIEDSLIDDSYELSSINGEANGIYAGNEVIVVYNYKKIERELIINKKNEDGENLEGVKFKVFDKDSSLLGNMTNNGNDYVENITDTSENHAENSSVISNGRTYQDINMNNEINDSFGELTANGKEFENNKEIIREIDNKIGNLTSNGTYCFVETDEGNYIPTNSKTYRTNNNIGTSGASDSVANSYMEIDLSELSGRYAVVINAAVSSESNYDFGYAAITTTTSAPAYSSENGKIMCISGTVSAKDYMSPSVEGGRKYYLHLGYRKDYSVDNNEDLIRINSIKLYEVDVEFNSCYFVQNDDGSYLPTNSKTYQVENNLGTTGIGGVTANSYLPINISNLDGKYYVVVEASVSSQSSNDYGYVTITNTTDAPTYSNSTGRFVYISGEVGNQKYISSALNGGNTYYLHMGYYKNASTDTGNDQIVIRSIKLYSAQDNTYSFVENSDGKLVPTNSKTWRNENYGINIGAASTTANSYVELDLTDKTGLYMAVVNASISSQSGNDYGYATITQTEEAPTYNNSNGRFMYISGNVSNTDYKSTILEGGNKYYLHLGYYKNANTDTGNDQVIINSINLYSIEQRHYKFGFEYDDDELCYFSTNQGKDSSISNSYIPIDLRNYDGQYTLKINASISSQSGYDYGYATITRTTTAPSYNSSSGRFIYISGERSASDYTKILDGGNLYYLHLGYYKSASTNSGDDRFRINSISIEEEYGYNTYTTNHNGQIKLNLKKGQYLIQETETLDGYDLLDETSTIDVNKNVDNIVLNLTNNKTKGKVIVHHYLLGTTTPVPMSDDSNAEDVIKEDELGEIYATKPLDGISPLYTCVGYEGQTSGTYGNGTIEVTYYYDYANSTVTVHHYLEGTTTSISNDVVLTRQITSHYETDPAVDIPEYYELAKMPDNREGEVTLEPKVVIYEYKLKKYPYTVNYYKDGTTEKLETSKNGAAKDYGTTIHANEEDIFIRGYKVVSHSIDELIIGLENNILNIYYDIDPTQVRNINYTVEYYKDGTKVEGDTEIETQTVQELGPYILTVDKSKINLLNKYVGYKLDSENTEIPDTIEDNGVIRVYYIKDNFDYSVEYYYDGIKDNEKTETKQAEYQSTVSTYTDKNITGYKLDRADGIPLTITENADNNVIKVYYVKDNFNYTVEYYYDGVKDNEKTETKQAEYQSTVSTYTDKNITGYKLDRADGIPLTITENADNNVIKVYYVKDNFNYKVEYYYNGVKDSEKTDTISATYQDEITTYTDKNITGYVFESVENLPLIVSENEDNNVIKVYYVKDQFEYTVEYYYDGVKDGDKSETLEAMYQDQITTYTDKNITGYKLDKVEPIPLIVTENPDENIMKVYYEKDTFAYTIEYYYDGEKDNDKTETLSDIYQNEITTYVDKVIPGYKLDKVETIPLVITENPENNIIKVYYTKDNFNCTVEYYYDGVKDDEKTETIEATYQDEITTYVDKNITGYKFDKVENFPLIVTENAEDNIIKVYYEKDSFEYTIEYYYDGEKDDEKTEVLSAKYQDEITTYPDKNTRGYTLSEEKNLPLVITENPDDNVIQIYYIIDDGNTKKLQYTIEFYKDNEIVEEDIIEKFKVVQVLQPETIEVEKQLIVEDKYAGYILDYTEPETIPDVVNDRDVIKVYYKRDNFQYRVEYYYDNNIDEESTETGIAEYGEIISEYIDKVKTGYKLKGEVEPVQITENVDMNVMKVYYEPDEEQTKDLTYKVEYYKNEELQEKDCFDRTTTVQVLQPDTITVDKKEINTTNMYEHCEVYKIMVNKKTVPKVPDIVNNNDTIKIYYRTKKSQIIIRYVDEYGNIISKEVVVEGEIDKLYDLSKVNDEVEGYELKSKSLEGITMFDDTTKEITYVYKKVKTPEKPQENNNPSNTTTTTITNVNNQTITNIVQTKQNEPVQTSVATQKPTSTAKEQTNKDTTVKETPQAQAPALGDKKLITMICMTTITTLANLLTYVVDRKKKK